MYLPSLPLALPLLMAALFAGTAKIMPERLRDSLAIVTAIIVTIVCIVLMQRSSNGAIVYWFGGWEPRDRVALGISFVIDPINAGLAMTKASLFLCSGILLHRFSSVDELELRGRGRNLLIPAVVFTLGGIGLAGMPLFGIFLGDTLIDEAAKKQGYEWIAAVIFVAAVLTGGAVLRVALRVFVGWGAGIEARNTNDTPPQEKPETQGGHDFTPITMLIPTVTFCLLALIVGVIPEFRTSTEQAALSFHDGAAYVERVLKGATIILPLPESHESMLPTIIRGTASTLGAIAIASVALFRHRLSGLKHF